MGTFITTLLFAVVFGVTTNAIIRNKGYSENWFWWGFFFGIFAVIVACTKPQCTYSAPQSSGFYNHQGSGSREVESFYRGSDEIRTRDTLKAGGWTCTCGRVNAAYVSSCTCGKDKCDIIYKKEVPKIEKPAESESVEQKVTPAAVQQDAITSIREYKSLLDDGIITQEEFDAKKKQLLGL